MLPEDAPTMPPGLVAYGAWVLENVLTDHTLPFDSPLELDVDTLRLLAGCCASNPDYRTMY